MLIFLDIKWHARSFQRIPWNIYKDFIQKIDVKKRNVGYRMKHFEEKLIVLCKIRSQEALTSRNMSRRPTTRLKKYGKTHLSNFNPEFHRSMGVG
jgi:hypothetical protein